ncbi:MAG: type VI secretion system baseplate subunit TssK [Planctomycetota bacterium]
MDTLPIHWHEGLFLRPQHFQQQGRWTEDRGNYQTMLTSPYPWGIVDLQVDPDAVRQKRLVIQRIEAVLESDFLCVNDRTLASPLERDLSEFDKYFEDETPLKVWLAVPKRGRRAIESDYSPSGGRPVRFKADPPQEIADETTGNTDEKSFVSYLKVNACLLAGDEDLSDYDTLQVAEIRARGGIPYLSDFVPPTLRVLKGSTLGIAIDELITELRDATGIFRAAAIGADQRKDHVDLVTERLKGLAYNTHLLPLQQMVQASCCHPFDLYLALLRLLGALTSVSRDDPGLIEAAPPPNYDHENLRESFGGLVERISDLIERESVGWVEVKVEEMPDREGCYMAKLDREQLNRDLCFAVYVDSSTDTASLHKWVTGSSHFGSPANIGELRDRNDPGVARQRVDPPPKGLRVRPRELVYRLQTDEYFETLRDQPVLCVLRAHVPVEGAVPPRSFKVYSKQPG